MSMLPYCRKRPIGSLVSVAAAFFLAVLLLFAAPAWARPSPSDAGKSMSGRSSEILVLEGINLGTMPDFSRVVFTFNTRIVSYTVQRGDVDEIWFNFGRGGVKSEGRLPLEDGLVQGVSVNQARNNVEARLKVKTSRFAFRHFTSSDQKSVILDLRRGAAAEEPGGDEVANGPKGLTLQEPQPQQLAALIRGTLPERPAAGTPEAMLAEAADYILAGNNRSAVNTLQLFKTRFPSSKLMEPAVFLLAEAYYFQAPEDLAANFVSIIQGFQEAFALYPDSPFMVRAQLLQGYLYMKMDYYSEASAILKPIVREHPRSEYAALAQMYLAEIYLQMKNFDQAKANYDALRALEPQGQYFLESYFKLGAGYFQEALYTKANEVFKEILGSAEDFYRQRPEILYYMGEGYFHLKRPDLSRAYLLHALNLNPRQDTADVILARVGDTYKEEGRLNEAIAIFRLTPEKYPDSVGALISRLRLAEYGALDYFFEAGSLFPVVKNGTPAADAAMYESIVKATTMDSPLLQVAYFKLGMAYFNQDNFTEAIGTFKKLLEMQPEGDMLDDARYVVSKAVLAEIKARYLEKRYLDLLDLYGNEKDLITELDWPEVRHYLALADLELNLADDAAKLLEANKDLTEHEDERLIGLGKAYLKLGRHEDAVRTFALFREKFPNDRRAALALMEQAKAEIAQDQDEAALANLERARAVDPKLNQDSEFQSMLGDLYLKQGQNEKGAAALEEAIQAMAAGGSAEEDVFLTKSRLGQAYAKLDRKEDAARLLGEALAVKPAAPFPEAVYLIARTYRELGLLEQAVSTLELLKNTPDPFWQDVAFQELQAMKPDEALSRLLGKQPETQQ